MYGDAIQPESAYIRSLREQLATWHAYFTYGVHVYDFTTSRVVFMLFGGSPGLRPPRIGQFCSINIYFVLW